MQSINKYQEKRTVTTYFLVQETSPWGSTTTIATTTFTNIATTFTNITTTTTTTIATTTATSIYKIKQQLLLLFSRWLDIASPWSYT